MDGPTRVSILEDQVLLQQSMCEALQSAGFDVVGQYADSAAFLSRLAADHPAVTIIDLQLHDEHGAARGDGLQVVREVHQRLPAARVLVFSNCTDPQAIERCYQEGAAGFLDKLSTERQGLIGAVRAVAQGERLFPLHLTESPLKRPPQQKPECPILQSLSAREREVLTYVAAGADNLKIATLLQISERTVKAHVSTLYRKLGSENRTQLALTALQLGVSPAPQV